MYNLTGGNVLIDSKFIIEKAGIAERMKVADLGCGALGHFVFPIAKIVGKSGKVYAVDIMKTVLETVNKIIKQENIKNIHTIWSNIEIFNATKIESGSLDVVLLINTLTQSNKRAETVRESARMLKRGGKLLIVEWKNVSLPFGPSPEDRVRIEPLKQCAEKLGLKHEETFDAGQYHYGALFSKL